MATARRQQTSEVVLKDRNRSAAEEKCGEDLERKLGSPPKFEELRLEYTLPATEHYYKPDWELPNGIIVEFKGHLDLDDQRKMLAVQAQHPARDIRFVFQYPHRRVPGRGKARSHAEWAEHHGFKWSHRFVPIEWINEHDGRSRADRSNRVRRSTRRNASR